MACGFQAGVAMWMVLYTARRSPVEVGDGRGRRADTDGGRGDDGRSCLTRQADEACPETHEAVPRGVELRGAASPLGEHHEKPVVLQ